MVGADETTKLGWTPDGHQFGRLECFVNSWVREQIAISFGEQIGCVVLLTMFLNILIKTS